jgi:hypothetical protein
VVDCMLSMWGLQFNPQRQTLPTKITTKNKTKQNKTLRSLYSSSLHKTESVGIFNHRTYLAFIYTLHKLPMSVPYSKVFCPKTRSIRGLNHFSYLIPQSHHWK